MDCATVQERLFDYLDGVLEEAERRRVAEHLDGCAECAEFAAALARPVEASADWTRGVLRRTVQAPCTQSLARLPEWIDGDLAGLDAQLVAGHVAHCAECTRVAGVLRALRVDLPELAEVEPDPLFLDDVLAATVGLRAESPSWIERLDRWLTRLWQRPRIAWEGAYVACVFLALLAAIPGSPLGAASRKALEWTRSDPDALEAPFVAMRASLDTGAQEAWFSTRAAARTLAVRASVESDDAYRRAKRGMGTLWNALASDLLDDEMQRSNDDSNNGEDP